MIVKSMLQYYFSTRLVLKFSASTYQMAEMTNKFLAFLQHAQVKEIYLQTGSSTFGDALLLLFAQV